MNKAEHYKRWYESKGRDHIRAKRSTKEGRAVQDKAEAKFKHTAKGWAYRLHCNARHNSRTKGRPPPTITREWILAELDKGCSVTGLPFVFDGPQRHPYAPSLDRIDCLRSYSPDNVRVVLYGVNVALGTWGLADYLHMSTAALLHAGASHH